ncbi:MAG: TadE/TadG family type IV pilus assembly protein [Gemmatimonadota bacterium]
MNRPRPLHGTRALRSRILRDDSGQEIAEMALILPFLLLLVLGIVEFGSIFGTSHSLTSLGREGANIAARGAPLDTVNALMLENGSEIDLAGHGGSITSRVVVQDSVPTIQDQVATDGYTDQSRLGRPGQPAEGLTRLAGAEGASFYVVELFYDYDDRTPLRRLLGSTVPEVLYSRAVF